MERRRLAIVGFGRLGVACVQAVREATDIELAGVVRRPTSPTRLPAPFTAVPVAAHLRDLGPVAAALLCVAPTETSGIACEMLQMRVPIVECARVEGGAAAEHDAAIEAAASNHRVAAVVVGAGWNPGMFNLFERAFSVLVPKGATTVTTRPGLSLHHTEAARNIAGVAAALATEFRNGDGRLTRYVYAELRKGADPARVQAALASDPVFAGERMLLFPVDSIAALEDEGHGVLLERRSTAPAGTHQNLLFEARFDVAGFAARIMVGAFHQLPRLKPGLHRYSLWSEAPAQRHVRH